MQLLCSGILNGTSNGADARSVRFCHAAKTRRISSIDTATGTSHGGFATLTGARIHAREQGLKEWQIWHGNTLVERHNPPDER